MLLEKPYFLTNKDWYVENVPKFLGGISKRQYTLTNKAPKKAIESYEKYYKELEKEQDT